MISRLGSMIRRFINLVLSNLIGQLQLVMVENQIVHGVLPNSGNFTSVGQV